MFQGTVVGLEDQGMASVMPGLWMHEKEWAVFRDFSLEPFQLALAWVWTLAEDFMQLLNLTGRYILSKTSVFFRDTTLVFRYGFSKRLHDY
jgi:hypothetical protein